MAPIIHENAINDALLCLGLCAFCTLHMQNAYFKKFFSKSTYFTISEIINMYLIYRLFGQKELALSESVNVF
jgi:hypothetical protein